MKKKRDALKWSQQKTADAMGVHVNTLNNLEKCVYLRPDLDTIKAVAKFVDVPVLDLVELALSRRRPKTGRKPDKLPRVA